MKTIKLNGRFYSHRPTGMQRYALELVKRMGNRLEVVRPNRPLKGTVGHLWEQFCLPVATGRQLLWSPNNTGPLAVSRQVCTIHDLIPIDRPEWFSPRFVALYRWLMPRLVSNLQHVVAISEFTKQRILENFTIDSSRITVVPNGVDSIFKPAAENQIQEVRKVYGLGDRPYVLCVSSFEPRKNLNGLLRAWNTLPDQVKDEYRLVLAGQKGSSSVFRDAGVAEPPPGAVFTGYIAQEHLPALYSGASVFAYPSLYEGFGLPPLEAMACGIPVLTSSTTSIPEVMGDAGVLVDPENDESIRDGLLRLLTDEDLRRSLAAKGIDRAQGLSWDRTAKETLAVLEAQAAA